jgi:hypothetical protein
VLTFFGIRALAHESFRRAENPAGRPDENNRPSFRGSTNGLVYFRKRGIVFNVNYQSKPACSLATGSYRKFGVLCDAREAICPLFEDWFFIADSNIM